MTEKIDISILVSTQISAFFIKAWRRNKKAKCSIKNETLGKEDLRLKKVIISTLL